MSDGHGVAGPVRFAKYAYPPNRLGYCGPSDHSALLEYVAADFTDDGLLGLARGFAGAWPYLELIAGASHRDPLDPEVVEAYWIGNGLLTAVRPAWLAASLDERFAVRLGTNRSLLGGLAASGGVPHHSFHVLAVSPWIGLLRAGFVDQPLDTIDRCRIRLGTVQSVTSGSALVETDRMTWDGIRLSPGPRVTGQFETGVNGYELAGGLQPGDRVALHWNWVCDRLTAPQAQRLVASTRRSVDLVNRAPIVVLDGAFGTA